MKLTQTSQKLFFPGKNVSSDKKNLDILAVILDVGLTIDNSSVFQSQVLDNLNSLRRNGYSIGILCVYHDKKRLIDLVNKSFENEEVKLFYQKDKGLVKNLFFISRKLRQIQSEIKISNAYVRGIWGAFSILMANPFLPIQYIYDVRGDLESEMKSINTNKFKLKIYLFLEKMLISKSRYVSVVSSKLKKLVSKKINHNKEIFVIPSCVIFENFRITQNEKESLKKELNISEEDLVILYSGGLSHYQKVPEMLNLWKKIDKDLVGLKFIFLSNSDPHSLPYALSETIKSNPSLRVLSFEREKILKILSIADIAFLLRDNNEINRHASPVKFAEYISSGLGIISSPGIGDVSENIEKNKIGYLISPTPEEAEYFKLLDFIKNFKIIKNSVSVNSKKLAKSNYDWNSHLEKQKKMFGKPSLNS